jgi:hypothetical protein
MAGSNENDLSLLDLISVNTTRTGRRGHLVASCRPNVKYFVRAPIRR